jgi:selenocysteine-specific elongation factor
MAQLFARIDIPAGEAKPVLEDLLKEGRAIGIGQGDQQILYTAAGWQHVTLNVTEILNDYHAKYPVRSGMAKAELGSRLKLGKNPQPVFQKLAAEGVVVEEGASIRLKSHEVVLTKEQQGKIDIFLTGLRKTPYSPPTDLTLEQDLLTYLFEKEQVVKVYAGVIFTAEAYQEMVEKVKNYIREHGTVNVGEVRDMFNTSRKYVLALLEYLDEKKVTRRTGDERVLY